MPLYEFTLILEGADVLSPQVFAALEGKCEDAVFGHRRGQQFADFEREHSSLVRAVASAVAEVESTETLRVVRVETSSAND